MALQIGTKTINIERRFKRLIINTNLVTNEYSADVDFEDGYYDENGIWKSISSGSKTLSNDQVLYLWSLNAKDFSINNNEVKVGDVIREMLYKIIGDTIDLGLRLDINVFDENKNPIQANVKIFRNESAIAYFSIPSSTYISPLILNAKIIIESNGYKTQEFNYPVLVGSINLNVDLVAETQN
jgi:hypothetical protein